MQNLLIAAPSLSDRWVNMHISMLRTVLYDRSSFHRSVKETSIMKYDDGDDDDDDDDEDI